MCHLPAACGTSCWCALNRQQQQQQCVSVPVNLDLQTLHPYSSSTCCGVLWMLSTAFAACKGSVLTGFGGFMPPERQPASACPFSVCEPICNAYFLQDHSFCAAQGASSSVPAPGSGLQVQEATIQVGYDTALMRETCLIPYCDHNVWGSPSVHVYIHFHAPSMRKIASYLCLLLCTCACCPY